LSHDDGRLQAYIFPNVFVEEDRHMAQLIKLGKFLVEIDGSQLVFFDAVGNPQGQPQDLSQATAVDFPDGSKMPVEQLTELLAGDPEKLADFQTAAGDPGSTELPTEADSGGGRFAAFEDQHGIDGLRSIGGLQQTESPDEDAPAQDLTRPDPEAPQPLSALIAELNTPPTAEGEAVRTPEDTAINGTVVGQDVDGDPLTYSLVDAPQHGTIVFHADGTFTYTPDGDYNGPDSFTFKANDGSTDSNVARVDITVQPINDLPLADGNTLTIAEDSIVNSSVHATDADNEALTFNLVDGPQHGALTFNADGTFTYIPNADYTGPDSFTFAANDGAGNSNVATVALDIRPENDLPISENGNLTLSEDSIAHSAVAAHDVDNDTLTYILVDAPQHGTLTFNADGTFSYTPHSDFNGADSFTFKANDGTGDSNVSTINLNISPVNDLPVSGNGSLTLAEDSVAKSSVHATDIDGDDLTYALVNGPQHGTIQFKADGTFTYTPHADYNGTDSFTFKANDGTGDSNVSTINLNISPVNDLPAADDGTVTLKEDNVVKSAVAAHDADGDAVSYALVSGPQHGTLQFKPDGTFTYTPNANYNGTDSFIFKANDGHGDGNVATMKLNVTPVDDAPVVTSRGSETEIHVTRVSVEQNPFGDSKVGDYLAAGGTNSKSVNPGMINGVDPSNLTLAQSADVKVSFVSEGAGYKSMVGTYTYDANGNIDPTSVKFLWLDATAVKENTAGSPLAKDFLGNTQALDISLGNLSAGTKMGFFIIADGASQSANTKAIGDIAGVDSKGDNQASDLAAINQHLSFAKDANGNGQILLDGKALTGNVYFTHDKGLNTDNNGNDIEHTLSGVTTKADGKLYVGFEDLAGGGDKDYDDVIFNVDIGDYNINKLSQTTTQPSVHISDIDSTHLSSAIVTTSGFHAGDVLNLPASSLFTVTAVAHGNDTTFTITPKAGVETVAVFEDFLNHAFFSTSTVEDGHRTISYQVTDAEGMTSNASTADVHVTASFEISSSELNNLHQLGSGDDILYLKKDFNTAVDMGAGTDTVHLQHGNMSFGSAEAKLLDNVEIVDAKGAGNNKVTLSADDVLDLTDGDHHLTILGQKGDTVTLTGDGTHHWSATAHDADFTTYTYNDGVHQAIVEVSNQMQQTVV
jgi:VCBS repeat-containing protein